MTLFLKALLIGLSIAAPVGPIGVLCIRRSMLEGARLGFVCGLGAASADALYALIGALALSGISEWMLRSRSAVTLVGAVFLLYLGARTFLSEPQARGTTERSAAAGLRAFASTGLLTLTNPLTILSFAAVFAGIAGPVLQSSRAISGTGELVAGVFLGSTLWWLLLSSAAAHMGSRLSTRALGWVNRACGLVLTGFGLYALADLVRTLS